MTGWLTAFERTDNNATHSVNTTYLSMQGVRDMVMLGQYPQDWQPREWGMVKNFYEAQTRNLPCADEDGYNPVWWEGTSCESTTREACHLSCSDPNASRLSAPGGGVCVCGLGSNGVAMCAVNGTCVERENLCTYFGEPCTMLPADSPKAPWR